MELLHFGQTQQHVRTAITSFGDIHPRIGRLAGAFRRVVVHKIDLRIGDTFIVAEQRANVRSSSLRIARDTIRQRT